MWKLALIAAALIALVAAGCGDDDPGSGTGGEARAAAGAAKPEVEVPDGEPPKRLVVDDIVVGDGAAAQVGDELTLEYVGVNFGDGSEFDSSWDRGEALRFELGSETVIAGWEEGLEGMRVGGRRRLTIPPGLAYGKVGSPPAIPPHETVVLVVDLIEAS